MSFKNLYAKSLYDSEKIAIAVLQNAVAQSAQAPAAPSVFAVAKTPAVGSVADLMVISPDEAGSVAILMPGDAIAASVLVFDSTGLLTVSTVSDQLKVHVKDYKNKVTACNANVLEFSEPHGFVVGERISYYADGVATLPALSNGTIVAVTATTVTVDGAAGLTLAVAQAGLFASSVQDNAAWWGFNDKALSFLVTLGSRTTATFLSPIQL